MSANEPNFSKDKIKGGKKILFVPEHGWWTSQLSSLPAMAVGQFKCHILLFLKLNIPNHDTAQDLQVYLYMYVFLFLML